MASFLRFGVSRVIKTKLLPNTMEYLLMVSSRGIISKSMREHLPKPAKKKPEPWPYKRRPLWWYNMEETLTRFDENTKAIVVEGPVAAGKTKVAKMLAEELDMYYFPEANLDMVLTNCYGFNIKDLDDQIPECCRSFDIKDFLANPRHRLVGSFQLKQFGVRYHQYLDAMSHLFSTGQGVVMERCVWSDFVFLEAMFKYGYLSKGVRSVYYDMRNNSLLRLHRPHLVIYLDVPINIVEKRIQKRNYCCEMQSTVLTPSYLQTMEDVYKQQYLKQISSHAELLVYDWSEEADFEIIIEDIMRIDFTKYTKQDEKMGDWAMRFDAHYSLARNYYSDAKEELLADLNVPRFDVPELLTDGQDLRLFYNALDNSPTMKYQEGQNPQLGDRGISFKGNVCIPALPLIERKLN